MFSNLRSQKSRVAIKSGPVYIFGYEDRPDHGPAHSFGETRRRSDVDSLIALSMFVTTLLSFEIATLMTETEGHGRHLR